MCGGMWGVLMLPVGRVIQWMWCCIEGLVHSGVLFDSTRSWCGEVLCLCSDFMMCSWVLMADVAALMIKEGEGSSYHVAIGVGLVL